MTVRLPRAEFIQGIPGQSVLYVIYGRGVGEDEVRPVVRQLSALRGIQARAIRGSVDDPHGPRVVVVEVTIQQSANRDEAMAMLKRLANPELPVAIRLLRMELLICRCDYLSSRLAALQFYPGLGPDDVEAFRLRYFAALQQVPVAQLFSAEPQPPYRLLTDGIETVLAGLGARATEVVVAPGRDLRPCTHPS